MSDESIRPRTELDDYRDALKAHDWWHMMSDDHRVYERGDRERKRLRALAVVLDPDHTIWNQYAPKGSGL
jgi:hypothetical protein